MKIRLFIFFLILSFGSQAKLSKASISELSALLGSTSDFTSHGTQPGLTFDVLNANNCGDCHTGFTADDLNFTPTATWSGSMMANATRDPLFWAAVDIANQDLPGVGDYCIRCHTPMGFYNGHTKDGSGDLSFSNGCKLTGTVSSLDNQLNEYQGVNCHFCHRQEPQGPSGENLMVNNSNIWLDDEKCNNPDGNVNFGPCRKGPYNPPLQDFHAWEFSGFIKKGEFCGSCHNVSSPEILTNGTLTIARKLWDNGVETDVAMPLERTFDEWKSSLFSDLVFVDKFGGDAVTTLPDLKKGQTCQDCHMPQSFDPKARACSQTPEGSRTGNLKKHELAGGNSWMPAVLKQIYGADLSAGTLDRNAAYDRTIGYAINMLQNQSALVETSIISSTATEAQVKVKVTNLTGHKLPSGYPEGRRMWINLTVKDSNDAIIFESGAYDVNTAILTKDASIKVYEAQQGIWDEVLSNCDINDNGEQQFHFVLNNCIAKDNRIPPLGFIGGSDLELKPVAANYPVDPNNPLALVNFDETNYTIAIPNGTSLPLSVVATLKYQTASKEYIEFLDNENTTADENTLCDRTQTTGPATQSRTAFMKTLWENNGKSAPVDMGNSMVQIN